MRNDVPDIVDPQQTKEPASDARHSVNQRPGAPTGMQLDAWTTNVIHWTTTVILRAVP
jgi:hypothetical protein